MNNRMAEYSVEELFPILLEVLESGGEFLMYPRGRSMLPLIREGRDAVYLKQTKEVQKNGIYLYRRENGQFVIHRLVALENDGKLTFCGDNQYYFERGIKKEQLIGEVVALLRRGKRISSHSAWHKCFIFLHCTRFSRFIRFFPRRAVGKLKRMIKR